MNKKLLSVACLMGAFSLYAQVGVGTLVPNKSAELAVISSERGLLIPNIALKDLTDAVTIKAGNIQSLLVYNTNSTNVLSPGYYYWEDNKWNRLLITEDIPQVVIDNFEEISQDVHVTNLIENIVRNSPGNVLYEDDKLYYIDESRNQITLLFSNDNFITILDYDANTGILTYKNERHNVASVDIKGAVKDFESVTKIVQNINENSITFYNEKGDPTVIDLNEFIKNTESVTTLVKNGPGKYTFTNEEDFQTDINVSGDLVDIIKGKLDMDLYNILRTFVKDHQSITRLFYNPTTKILNFTDEKDQSFDYDLTQIVQDSQERTRIDADASKNILVQSSINGNTLTYTLEVKPATTSSLGVVQPGSGLLVDQEGVLSVDVGAIMQGKDLKGSNKIVVTNGQGAVLKEVGLDIDQSKLSLQNIGGVLNLTQLVKGNKGDILIVDENGDIIWSALDLLISNSLILNNSSLVSTVNGQSSSVSLVDKISTKMLQDRAVTQDKLGATPAQKAMVGVVQSDGSVVYQKLSSDIIESKLLQSANNLLTVTNGDESVLKDVTLSINQANFDLSLIGGKLTITQIQQGNANTVLTTNNSGELEWVNKTLIAPEIIHNLSSANNSMTSTISGIDKSADIIAEVAHTLDGSDLTTSVNGVESNKINLASIDHTSKVLEGDNVSITEDVLGNETSYTVSVSDNAIQAAQTTSSVEGGTNATVVSTPNPLDSKDTVYTVSVADTAIQGGQIITKVDEGFGVKVGYQASNSGKLHTYTVEIDSTKQLLNGDVKGVLSNNTVVALQGVDVSNAVPLDNQVLTYDLTSKKWIAKTPSVSAKVSVEGGLNTTVIAAADSLDVNKTIYKVNVKSALPSFFYMPSVLVPTSAGANLPAGVTFNNTTRKGEIKLYEIFNNQFESPVSQSDSSAELPSFEADELNYFVTYADPNVFVNVNVSPQGVLTYEVLATANVSVGAFMNIVFSIR